MLVAIVCHRPDGLTLHPLSAFHEPRLPSPRWFRSNTPCCVGFAPSLPSPRWFRSTIYIKGLQGMFAIAQMVSEVKIGPRSTRTDVCHRPDGLEVTDS